MNDLLQDHRLDTLETNQRAIIENQRHMQTQLAVMQSTLDRIASDHEQVAVLKEKIERLERLVYGALAGLGLTALGVLLNYLDISA